jgi:alanine dehydrogenase
MRNSRAERPEHGTPRRSHSTLVLTRGVIAELLDLDACIEAVERAFGLHGRGRSFPPGVLAAPVEHGGFHIKSAGLSLERPYFAAKVNANFPGNRERFGLPTIQGVIALFDATNGELLALLDSIEITSIRTAAATAVAARHLALPDASVATVCGCGDQGRAHVRAMRRVRPIRVVHAIDADRERAERFAQEMTTELGLDVRVTTDLARAAAQSDIIVTCTPSRRPLVRRGDPRPGAFVAAIGADSPDKQELEPELVAECTIVVDLLAQCITMGDLHHAIDAGLMSAGDVHAELGEVVTGAKPGRTRPDEIVIFDSTGTALQDVAVAAMVYERAQSAPHGIHIAFGIPESA